MDFVEFKNKASAVLNINLDGYKIKRVKRRTDSLMRRRDIESYEECLFLIKDNSDFRRDYINHFTINTTEFYRNPENYKYLQEVILPELLGKNRKIKIWSAPCANGAEPYTVAIILNELGVNKRYYKILASDLDLDIIQAARKGIYSDNIMKEIPPAVKEKYFIRDKEKDKHYLLSKSIKKSVDFECRDLICGEYRDDWDLIISRNFFIYLTKELKEKIIKKFTATLKKDGYLFLGNTEFIFGPDKFGLEKVDYSFYRKI